ncbi:MAG: hypothetical protein ACR2RD_14305 [Woeseiaceae bacterium]
MTYLLAKYTVLFLLTALLGFALGYWFSRRKFVDVSESYEDLRKASTRSDMPQWNQLWSRLDAMPAPKETDLSGVYERIAGVTAAISKLPRPEPVSFTSLEDRFDSLHETVRGMPSRLIPKDPNFHPLIDRLDKLEGRVKAIPKPAPPPTIDLTPVQSELGSIRGALRAIPVVESHDPVDLSPVTTQLNNLEKKFSTLPVPQSVDLAPVDRRLTAIEAELGNLGKRLVAQSTQERAPRKTRRKEPRILSAALYGKKDNLKMISGVGPKLENLLNKNGVFYFWQVADWNARDIDIIDERLDAFKGRIARDNWVSQAKRLRRTPDAARMPAD